MKVLSLVALAATITVAQQKDSKTKDYHPPLSIERCDASGCTVEKTKVVLDANWRWFHKDGENCFLGTGDFTQQCKDDPDWCAKNCELAALDQANYQDTYGVSTPGEGKLRLNYRNQHQHGTSVGSRLYLLNEKDDKYKMFNLNNKEFTFDADVSKLDCGLNGALYFVEMEPDGHMTTDNSNTAGSAFGTGYCDAQCPHDVKYIYGKPNSEGYTKGVDGKPGGGKYGICCTEMDIWEANMHSNAYTPHACLPGYKRCDTDEECGEGEGNRYKGFCDKDGCDFNPYRNGDTEFYGPGKTVDTNKKVTVITQFITADGTDNGQLTEIRRLYVQDGKVIENPPASWKGSEQMTFDAKGINDPFCYKEKEIFGELSKDDFSEKDGLQPMGEALNRGLVLVLSVWTDPSSKMNWLDSTTGHGKGAKRGTCDPEIGNPETYNNEKGDKIYTEFANIKYGALGTTFKNDDKDIKSVPPPRPVDPKNTKTIQTEDPNYKNGVFEYPEGVTPNTGAGGSGGKAPSTRPNAVTPSTKTQPGAPPPAGPVKAQTAPPTAPAPAPQPGTPPQPGTNPAPNNPGSPPSANPDPTNPVVPGTNPVVPAPGTNPVAAPGAKPSDNLSGAGITGTSILTITSAVVSILVAFRVML